MQHNKIAKLDTSYNFRPVKTAVPIVLSPKYGQVHTPGEGHFWGQTYSNLKGQTSSACDFFCGGGG